MVVVNVSHDRVSQHRGVLALLESFLLGKRKNFDSTSNGNCSAIFLRTSCCDRTCVCGLGGEPININSNIVLAPSESSETESVSVWPGQRGRVQKF